MTGVSVDRTIGITFSESMDRGFTEEAVFLSPHAALDLRWDGPKLIARPRDGLLPDRTYVVTVGTDARDARGNRLENSYTFAFATGEQLNRGRLSGAVSDGSGPARSARVWAYDVSQAGREAGEIGVAPADYQTQTGSDGTFEFQRLSRGTYRVIAFGDENDNGRFDRGEKVALPSRDATLEEGGDVPLGDLLLSAAAEKEVRLERAQAVDTGRVLLVFGAEVDVTDVDVTMSGLEVVDAYRTPDDRRKLYLVTGAQEKGRAYRIEVNVAGEEVEWDEPVRGSARADRTPPSLVAHRPRTMARADESVVLYFSEPLASLPGEAFWARGDSLEAPAGTWVWANPVQAEFAPTTPWPTGAHRLRANLSQLRDRAGQAPSDSVAALEFEVIAEAEMAAISGRVTGGTGYPVWVEVREGGSKARGSEASDSGTGRSTATRTSQAETSRTEARRVQAGPDGAFTVDALLPGPVQVSAFEDRDGNGVRDAGERDPYEAAEAGARLRPDPVLGRGEHVVDLVMELR